MDGAVFLLLIFSWLSASSSIEVKENHDWGMITEELKYLHDRSHQQELIMAEMKDRHQLLENIISEQDGQIVHQKTLNDLEETVAQQQKSIQHLKSTEERLEAKVENLKDRLLAQETKTNGNNEELPGQDMTPPAEVRDQHQAFGCMADTLSLSCPNGRLITVTRAYYGQYLQTTACSQTCCAPNPYMDCTELVSENEPGEWLALKYICDNQTSCSFEYDGTFINDCETGYVADYMQIFYSCLPYDENESVAFTAWATTDRDYEYDDIVLFDELISNIGNAYNRDTSSFTCPYNGLYLFGVSFYSGYSTNMYIDIMRNNVVIISSLGENLDSDYSHASALVTIECTTGDLVWVKDDGSSDWMASATARRSHFTGVLLSRYSQ